MTPCGDPLIQKLRTGYVLICWHHFEPKHNHKDVYGLRNEWMSAFDAMDSSPSNGIAMCQSLPMTA